MSRVERKAPKAIRLGAGHTQRGVHNYYALPELSTLLEVPGSLEAKTVKSAASGIPSGTCKMTLEYASKSTGNTLVRAQAVLNTYSSQWSRCVAGACAARKGTCPPSLTAPPPSSHSHLHPPSPSLPPQLE
jgi:hypothetical protein